MSYKTIKAYLPTVESVDIVLPAAFNLAQGFGSHVTGVHVIEGIRYYSASEAYVPSDFYQTQRDAFKEQADRIQKAFLNTAAHNDSPYDFQCDGEFHENQIGALCTMARACDLFVTAHESQDDLMLDWDTASSVAMDSGRPVLVIPRDWGGKPVGQRVMIAWNGSRESARAAFDALPLLKQASDVVILTVDIGYLAGRTGFSPADELAAILSRHETPAEVVALPDHGGSIANDIQSQIAAHGSDLLVMGCYGHARMRELILGGTTRSILADLTIPTLMSH